MQTKYKSGKGRREVFIITKKRALMICKLLI